ncbi:lysophospholipid acyltransferase family protein [Amycolatopsis sp. NPDC005003]
MINPRREWHRRDLKPSFFVLRYVFPGPILKAIIRPRVKGLERLAAEGPVILAPNHLSPFDPFLLSLVCPRRIIFLAKREYFEAPGIRGALMRTLFESQGQISTIRGGTIGGLNAVDAAVASLEAGKVFGVFPEGTRGRAGRLYRGHTGVAQAAFRAGVPVHPVVITGTEAFSVKALLTGKLTHCTVEIGEPIAPPPDVSPKSPKEMHKFTKQVMARIAELGNLEIQETFSPGRAT